MPSQTITSADSIINLTVTNLYPSGFQLQEFEAQNIFDFSDTEVAETLRTADGKLVAGFVYGDLSQVFHLAASSPNRSNIETWYLSQRTAVAIFRCNATVILPSLGKKYTCTNGVLTQCKVMPTAGRVLQPVTFTIQWETVTPEAFSA